MRKAALVMVLVACAGWILGSGSGGPLDPVSPGREAEPVETGPWTELGPQGGNVMGLVRNPKSPSELYAATYAGLIYRSTNNGASWARRTAINSEIYDLAIDPKNPSILYGLAYRQVYKSVNKGLSFTATNLGQDASAPYGRIAVHPTNPQVLFIIGVVCYDRTNWRDCLAVLKSVNGGQSWTVKKLDPTSKWAYGYGIAVSPKNPSLLFACGFYYPVSGNLPKPAVFRSTNAGATWKNVTSGALSSEAYLYPYAVAVDPTNPKRAYIASNQGLFRTVNTGTTWTKQTSPVWMAAYSLAVDKSAPNKLYGGYYGCLYRSLDGGANWTELSDGLAGAANRMLALGPTVHFASAAGIFKSVNGGTKFTVGHKGILATDIKSFIRVGGGGGAAQGAAATLYAALAGYAMFHSKDGGATWARLGNFQGSDAVHCIVSPRADPRRLYVSTFG